MRRYGPGAQFTGARSHDYAFWLAGGRERGQVRAMNERTVRMAQYTYRQTILNPTGLPGAIRSFMSICKGEGAYMIALDISAAAGYRSNGFDCSEMLISCIAKWAGGLPYNHSALFRLDTYQLAFAFTCQNKCEALETLKRFKDRFNEAWLVEGKNESICFFCKASLSLIRLISGVEYMLRALVRRALAEASCHNREVIIDQELDALTYSEAFMQAHADMCVRAASAERQSPLGP